MLPLDSAFFIFDIYPEVQLLDHRVVVFLSFRGTAMLFPTTAIPFHIPTSSTPELQFLYLFINTYYFLFY